MFRRILYKLSASPPAMSVAMLADLLAVEIETVDVDWKAMEHKSSEYLQMNPMGTIPVLKDGDFTISESHAILKYLVQKYGGKHKESLYPSDIEAQVKVDERLYFNAGLFFIRLKVVALPTIMRGLPGPTEQHLADIEAAYGMVEAYLANHSFVAADHLTLADLSVGTTAAFMQPILKLNAEKFPRTAAWLARLEENPVFSKHSAPALPTIFGGLRTTPKHLADIEEAYSVVEAYLGDKDYVAGDHLTLADLSDGVTAASIQVFLKTDPKKFPSTNAWLAKLYQLPEFKKYCEPGFDILTKLILSAWETNKLKQN